MFHLHLQKKNRKEKWQKEEKQKYSSKRTPHPSNQDHYLGILII